MAEAAEAAGSDGQVLGGTTEILSGSSLDGALNSPLENLGIPSAILPGSSSELLVTSNLQMGMSTVLNPINNMGSLMGPSFGTIGLNIGFNPADVNFDLYAGNLDETVSDFFEDPSLYDDFAKNENIAESNDAVLSSFYINDVSDFGKTFSNFSIIDTLTINFTFDPPSSSYSVTRSNFYEYDSTSSNLRWDSKPSSSSQTVPETEPNGDFSNAQVINRSSFKGGSNSDVADGTLHWVKITGGWINNGVDLFKVDLQQGETLIIDIDYGDSYGDSINTYVTLYNASQVSVAENDDSAISLGGGGSSGTGDSYISYVTSTTESFYIFVEDSPKNSNSSTAGDFVVNLSIIPTNKSTGLGTSSNTSVGGDNKLPYIFNFTEDTNNHMSKSFKSDLISSIKYTDSTSGTGSEVFLIAGNGSDTTIWLWDDLSEGYGIGDNELTLVANLPNFDNDLLTGSEIVFGTIW